MAFSEWRDFCPHTVTIEPFVSQDLYGQNTYGAPVTYQARVQGRNVLVRTVTGEERVARAAVYIQPTAVSAQDRITLPAIFAPTQPAIYSVAQVSDESGPHHTVIYCGDRFSEIAS